MTRWAWDPPSVTSTMWLSERDTINTINAARKEIARTVAERAAAALREELTERAKMLGLETENGCD